MLYPEMRQTRFWVNTDQSLPLLARVLKDLPSDEVYDTFKGVF